MTRTGTTVNSFHTELTSVISGSNLGIPILPFEILTTVIPAVITRKKSASATAMADVIFNESTTHKKKGVIKLGLLVANDKEFVINRVRIVI